ncbi:MAG TPA: nitronate monooxygenase, partial [Candidatus Jeotgalibaca pullicola]|nr:nitronate monooxygenase [Candidatus Jeotgalibaca pullicola]
ETSKEKPDFSRMEAMAAGALRRAVVEGDKDYGSMMAGQIAGLIKKEESCKEIIEDYMAVCKDVVFEQTKIWAE